ncbi:hypothetical protein BD779DRAFT_1426391, partial [Infundibulicybe gibba]
MDRLRRSLVHKAHLDVHRASRPVQTQGLDQIQFIDPTPRATLEVQPLDFEKPRLSGYCCAECAKHISTRCLGRSKVHKRQFGRRKQLEKPAYIIEEVGRAAGLGRCG